MEKVYTQDWFTSNIPVWNEILIDKFQLKGKDNLTFLEIGCFEGRSSNYLLNEVMTGKNCILHVVDIWEFGENQYRTFVNNTIDNRERVVIHSGQSGNVLKRDFFGPMFDFIYIDGSHSAADVLQDAVLCHPLLKVGGIMLFDDYLWQLPTDTHAVASPKMGVDFFYTAYQRKYRMIHQAYQASFIKITN